MAERLASYPFRCHWPDEVSNEPPGVWVEMPGFVAVERPSELFAGYMQVLYAAHDVATAVHCLGIMTADKKKLHLTAAGPVQEVESFVDQMAVHGFRPRDVHIEMVARPFSPASAAQGVRRATVSDEPSALRLLNEVFPAYQIYDPDSFRAALIDAHSAVFVMGEPENLIGLVSGETYGEPRKLFLHTLAVLPQYRGRGFGRALTETLLNWAGDRGVSGGMLWLMDQRNEAAMRLYESLGFKDTGGREAELLKE